MGDKAARDRAASHEPVGSTRPVLTKHLPRHLEAMLGVDWAIMCCGLTGMAMICYAIMFILSYAMPHMVWGPSEEKDFAREFYG